MSAPRLQTTLMLLPSLALTALLLLAPMGIVAVMSLTDWQFGASHFDWIGLQNYRNLWDDPGFRKAFRNTVYYLIWVSLGSITVGLMGAVLIEAHTSLRSFYRTALFLPVASTLIGMAVVWQFMLHPTLGLLNRLIGLAGIGPYNWLRDYDLALPTLAVIGIWQMSGLAMVMFLAGLKAIPPELRHAAWLDGMSNPVDRLLRLLLPLLGPTMLFVVTVCAIRALQVFDTVHVLTQGGPNKATDVLLHSIYAEGFGFFRMGYASAMTVVFVVCIFVLTLVQHKGMDKRTHYS